MHEPRIIILALALTSTALCARRTPLSPDARCERFAPSVMEAWELHALLMKSLLTGKCAELSGARG